MTAIASQFDPTGGILSAVAAHLITNATSDSAIRIAAQDIWADILVQESEERRKQFGEAKEEFTRQRHILEWLMEDLEQLRGRVENLEIVALGLLRDAESLLRERPEPEMREYMLAAWRNVIACPDRFPSSWTRRLTSALAAIGREHLIALATMRKHAKHVLESGAFEVQMSVGVTSKLGPDSELLISELQDAKLCVWNTPFLQCTGTAARLLEFVGLQPSPDDNAASEKE